MKQKNHCCKFCGKTEGLRWGKTVRNGWRLFETATNKAHICAKFLKIKK